MFWLSETGKMSAFRRPEVSVYTVCLNSVGSYAIIKS